MLHAGEVASKRRVSLTSIHTRLDAAGCCNCTMAESARKKQRPSPKSDAQATPNNNATLQLITPFRRAVSAGPTPGSRRTPIVRTPGTIRTPRGGPATRPLPSRRVAPTTPHAIRALRERANAARTPGNNRRRSGRVQRETPRDLLRDLSRGIIFPFIFS